MTTTTTPPDTDTLEARFELFHQHRADIHAFAMSRLRNAQDAEDVVQETYYHIWRALPTLSEVWQPSARGYAFTTAANLITDRFRKKRKVMFHLFSTFADDPTNETEPRAYEEIAQERGEEQDFAAQVEMRLLLEEAMEGIAPEWQERIALAAGGYTYQELADEGGVKPATMKTAVIRKREIVRKRLVALLAEEK